MLPLATTNQFLTQSDDRKILSSPGRYISLSRSWLEEDSVNSVEMSKRYSGEYLVWPSGQEIRSLIRSLSRVVSRRCAVECITNIQK